MTTDLRKELAEETEASEAGRDMDAIYHRNTRPAKEASQVYSLRLPVERIEEIRTLAASTSVAPTTLMRRWVLERLDDELGRRTADEMAARSKRVRSAVDDAAIRSLLEEIVDERLRGELG